VFALPTSGGWVPTEVQGGPTRGRLHNPKDVRLIYAVAHHHDYRLSLPVKNPELSQGTWHCGRDIATVALKVKVLFHRMCSRISSRKHFGYLSSWHLPPYSRIKQLYSWTSTSKFLYYMEYCIHSRSYKNHRIASKGPNQIRKFKLPSWYHKSKHRE